MAGGRAAPTPARGREHPLPLHRACWQWPRPRRRSGRPATSPTRLRSGPPVARSPRRYHRGTPVPFARQCGRVCRRHAPRSPVHATPPDASRAGRRTPRPWCRRARSSRPARVTNAPREASADSAGSTSLKGRFAPAATAADDHSWSGIKLHTSSSSRSPKVSRPIWWSISARSRSGTSGPCRSSARTVASASLERQAPPSVSNSSSIAVMNSGCPSVSACISIGDLCRVGRPWPEAGANHFARGQTVEPFQSDLAAPPLHRASATNLVGPLARVRAERHDEQRPCLLPARGCRRHPVDVGPSAQWRSSSHSTTGRSSASASSRSVSSRSIRLRVTPAARCSSRCRSPPACSAGMWINQVGAHRRSCGSRRSPLGARLMAISASKSGR